MFRKKYYSSSVEFLEKHQKMMLKECLTHSQKLGTIAQKLEGNWQKQSIVLQQAGEYGKPVCIMFWGDKADVIDTMNIGDILTVAVNVESREYNGKYFSDIKAWKVTDHQKTGGAPRGTWIKKTNQSQDGFHPSLVRGFRRREPVPHRGDGQPRGCLTPRRWLPRSPL